VRELTGVRGGTTSVIERRSGEKQGRGNSSRIARRVRKRRPEKSQPEGKSPNNLILELAAQRVGSKKGREVAIGKMNAKRETREGRPGCLSPEGATFPVRG